MFRPASLRSWARKAAASMTACAALAAAAPLAFAQVAASPAAGLTLPGHVPALVNSSALEGPVLGDQPVRLALSLPLRDQPDLNGLLHSLYDATSRAHGQYLTPQQFTDRFGPTQADYDTLTQWATAHGLTVTQTTPSRTLLDVIGTAAAVQAAFNVHLLRYLDPTGREFYAPDADPTVDPSLAGVLRGVVGLDSAVVLAPAGIGTGPGGGLAPADIKSVYNLNGTSLNGAGQTIAVAEFSNFQQGGNNDVQTYEAKFGLPNVSITFTNVDGGAQGYGAPQEVAGDLDMLVALAPGAKVLCYFAPNTTQGAADLYAKIANDTLAKQVSTSWYYQENGSGVEPDVENTAFQQMAAQGQTMFAASGDNGTYANGTSPSVLDPASQPYVCAVGGTSLSVNDRNTGPNTTQVFYNFETAWQGTKPDPNHLNYNGGGTGGGVSSLWPIPYYQSQPGVVSGASQGSYTSRDVPDVALGASGTGYSIYFTGPGGGWQVYGGTSFATPLWAAFTALVNQQRANYGYGTVGFLDQYLYQIGRGTIGSYAADFHDITSGSNGYPTANPSVPGFPAVSGYDLTTGWGSFNGANLLSVLSTTSGTAPDYGPFYVYYDPYTYGHFYTLNIDTARNAAENGDQYNGIAFHAYYYPQQVPGLTAFYYTINPNTGDNFYTASYSDYQSHLASGYTDGGVACYLYPTGSPPSGTVPLYRVYTPSTQQHLYTTSQNLYNQTIGNGGQGDGVVAYVLP